MSHGRRETQKTYNNDYSRLVFRYGEKCAICKRKIGDAYPKEITNVWNLGLRITKLQIDHVNGNADDKRFENKQLCCEACNIIKALQPNDRSRALRDAMLRAPKDDADGSTGRAANDSLNRASVMGVDCERERERMRLSRQSVERDKWSLEIKISQKAKESLWKYLKEKLLKETKLEWQAVLDAGAYLCDCSQQSIDRYLKALCSDLGPLRWEIDADTLKKCVMFKALKNKETGNA